MCKILIAVLAACIGLAGSASLVGAELFSATGKVIAILADELFVGAAQGHLSGAGTLAIHSQKTRVSPASESSLPAPHWVVRGRCVAVTAPPRHFIFSA
jgi:hypothetical protein